MNPNSTRLPPLWIKVFSWLSLVYLVVPVLAIWQISTIGTQLGVSAFGLALRGDLHPLSWIIALDLVAFMAGLTGLFILTRRRFAYDFGIFHCAINFIVTIAAHFIIRGHNEMTWLNVSLQYPLLLLFSIHLIRHRGQWIAQHGEVDGGRKVTELHSSR